MIIPAVQPYEARYAHEGIADPNGKPRVAYSTKPVIAWSDDGRALVVNDDGRLVPADTWRNFHDVAPADPRVVAAVPGGGWIAEYANDDGSTHSSPIVAWNVYEDGTCIPVDTDGTGACDEITSLGNLHRIYHPDIPETA